MKDHCGDRLSDIDQALEDLPANLDRMQAAAGWDERDLPTSERQLLEWSSLLATEGPDRPGTAGTMGSKPGLAQAVQ
jgi:hypothetical protein